MEKPKVICLCNKEMKKPQIKKFIVKGKEGQGMAVCNIRSPDNRILPYIDYERVKKIRLKTISVFK